MQYRRAAPTDLERVRALLAACGLPTADLSPLLAADFLVAMEADALVGCVALEQLSDGALLRSLAVDPAHRGRGIGERLCDEAEASARAAGVATLFALTATAADYLAARGFRPMPRESLPPSVQATAQFRELCPATAVAMCKKLG